MASIPVRVAVRIRPLSTKELDEGCQHVVNVVSGRPQIHMSSLGKSFTFDHALDASCSQSEVYESCVAPMMSKLFDGYNATILAYGQTGSGKTHSMGTNYDPSSATSPDEGIIPRSVRAIFNAIEERSDQLEVDVRVAFIELYREQLYDLLVMNQAKKEDCVLELREDPNRGVVASNLTECEVSSLEETMNELRRGSQRRATAATAMNDTSSRSHAIFTILLHIKQSNDAVPTVSKLHLVDLAGSERNKKTLATGERQKEGIAINQGLLALGNVISALGDPSRKGAHVPYRDSKLTRLLQDSLGGNSYTLMLSCVSPSDSNVDETVSTLRYSDRARKIKNKPIVNVDDDKAELHKLRLEVQELRARVLNADRKSPNSIKDGQIDELKTANRRLREENKELSNALITCQSELAHTHEKIVMQDAHTESLKEKLRTVLQSLDEEKENTNEDLVGKMRGKLSQLIQFQNEGEKAALDHELAHKIESDEEDDEENSNDEDDFSEVDEGIKVHSRKQSVIANQLLQLNKGLAQKEKLVSDMNVTEEQMLKLRKSYEESATKLKEKLDTLEKEKQELLQQTKNKTANEKASQISEKRRLKIRELETQICELKKKLVEQERASKLQERSASQMKKLCEEIRQMKVSRVKLIRQMREDNEKMRNFKASKERELLQLKQKERKQEAKMAKMETLHTKQTNVLKRKMEDAVRVNKRLKETLEKQRAKSKMKKSTSSSLAGAGEKVRGWINEEMEMAISVKEARSTHEQLITDRAVLNRQLNALKNEKRRTLCKQELFDIDKKIEELQSELDMRNSEIASFQRQIADLEESDDTNAQNGEKGSNERFDSLSTLTEAKIALQHLFERSVELSLSSHQTKTEQRELRALYEETLKNTKTLEKEIAQMKQQHEEDMFSANSAHHQEVVYLLSAITSQNDDKNRAFIKKEDQLRVSKLVEALTKLSEENESLRKSQETNMVKNSESYSRKRRLDVGAREEPRYTVEEFFNEDSEDDSDENEHGAEDPDWRQTPLFNRLRKIRGEGNNNPNATFIKQRSRFGNDDDDQPAAKRHSDGLQSGCQCKTGCKNKRCPCRKHNNQLCSDNCKCNSSICSNRALSDITNSSTNTTALLADESYQIENVVSSTTTEPTKHSNRNDDRNSFFKPLIEKEEPSDL